MFPETHLKQSRSITDKGDHVIKVLRLQWELHYDFISYSIMLVDVTCTKCGVISTITCIFDSMGWLAPAVFLCKVDYATDLACWFVLGC